jgi:TetR/AcrR family transcriptional regulator
MSKPTYEQILDVAEDAFAERGFDAASLSEIAATVGISGPGIYKHFKSKRAVYEAVMARLIDPYFEIMEKEIRTEEPSGDVMTAVRRLLLHHVEHPNLARLVHHAALAGGEQLELLVERWYQPAFLLARERLFESESSLSEDAMRTAIMAFHSMVLGYVSLASLHGNIFGTDPLGEAEVERFYDVICLVTEDLRR